MKFSGTKSEAVTINVPYYEVINELREEFLNSAGIRVTGGLMKGYWLNTDGSLLREADADEIHIWTALDKLEDHLREYNESK